MSPTTSFRTPGMARSVGTGRGRGVPRVVTLYLGSWSLYTWVLPMNQDWLGLGSWSLDPVLGAWISVSELGSWTRSLDSGLGAWILGSWILES